MKTRTYVANYRSGLIGLLAGERLSKSLDRVLGDVDSDGMRVVFLVKDQWSIWTWLWIILATLLTLGLFSRRPGYLIVAEAVDDAAGPTPEQQIARLGNMWRRGEISKKRYEEGVALARSQAREDAPPPGEDAQPAEDRPRSDEIAEQKLKRLGALYARRRITKQQYEEGKAIVKGEQG